MLSIFTIFNTTTASASDNTLYSTLVLIVALIVFALFIWAIKWMLDVRNCLLDIRDALNTNKSEEKNGGQE